MSSDKSNQLLIREAIRKIALGRSMERISLAPGGMSGIGTARMIHGYVAKIHEIYTCALGAGLPRNFPSMAVPLMSASTRTRQPLQNPSSTKAYCFQRQQAARAVF